MKETIRIELTQDQYDALSAIGVADCEIKTIGCTMPFSDLSSNHHMTIGVKKPITAGVEWNGEGVPPVGLECEWIGGGLKYGDWGRVVVHAYANNQAWIEKLINGSLHTVGNPAHFRKLETEAERNERELEEMTEYVCDELFAVSAQECREDVVATVYAMLAGGYRKAVTNE